jgi:glutathione S-transferase
MAVLYSFRRCPYAMRGRMALRISGESYEHREILLRDKPDAMLKASPKGTVPVFITDNGKVIDESLDLALWALGRRDPENWLESFDAELAARNDGPFKTHLDRYKYASRYDSSKKRGEIDTAHRAAALEILLDLNDRLTQYAYLSGPERSLTDIAIFPFIRQFAAVEPAWWQAAPLPALRRWLDGHLQSELFKNVMIKHPLWQPA